MSARISEGGSARRPRSPLPTIAIMQGRLSVPIDGQIQAFPAAAWAGEFARAAAAELDAIEWIFDGPANPLLSADGVARVRQLTQATGVRVLSVCADFFMDAPLHRGSDDDVARRGDVLRALLDRTRELEVRHIVLPFVDQSAIRDASERDRLVEVMADLAGNAIAGGVELHLETSLDPREFALLLERMPPVVKANYDSGNSASLGYDVADEFTAYGARIGSVHVKDRVRGGSTVPLGAGDVDFAAFFDSLDRVAYAGLFTLQVARGKAGAEVELARENRAFVLRLLNRAAEPR